MGIKEQALNAIVDRHVEYSASPHKGKVVEGLDITARLYAEMLVAAQLHGDVPVDIVDVITSRGEEADTVRALVSAIARGLAKHDNPVVAAGRSDGEAIEGCTGGTRIHTEGGVFDLYRDASQVPRMGSYMAPGIVFRTKVPAQIEALAAIAKERRRQRSEEGFTIISDRQSYGEPVILLMAARAYLGPVKDWSFGAAVDAGWPWDQVFWKPKGYERDLARAGALAMAYIEAFGNRADAHNILRDAMMKLAEYRQINSQTGNISDGTILRRISSSDNKPAGSLVTVGDAFAKAIATSTPDLYEIIIADDADLIRKRGWV